MKFLRYEIPFTPSLISSKENIHFCVVSILLHIQEFKLYIANLNN